MAEYQVKGPRPGGGPAHERLLLANLAAALFVHKSIKTTETKARRLRPLAERLITLGKRGDLHARRRAMTVLRSNKDAAHILFNEIAPLVTEREGGYTRITKVGNRKGDNVPMAVIELVLDPVPSVKRRTGNRPQSTRTTRRSPSSRTLHEFSASTREQLASVAQVIGVELIGYGREEKWVLASRSLRDLRHHPALLQITRTDSPRRFRVRVTWIGEEPDVPEELLRVFVRDERAKAADVHDE